MDLARRRRAGIIVQPRNEQEKEQPMTHQSPSLTPLDQKALAVMREKGLEFAEQQQIRHWANEWDLPLEGQEERGAYWKAVCERIKTLATAMEHALQEGHLPTISDE
jgi:hypothetical protein